MDLEDGSGGGAGSVEGEKLSDSLLKDESVILFESVEPLEHGVEKSVTVEEGSSLLVQAVVEKTLTECELSNLEGEETRLLLNGSSGEDAMETVEQRCQELTEFGNVTQQSSEAGLSMPTDSDISEPPAAGNAVLESSALDDNSAANSVMIETPSCELIVKASVAVLEPSAADNLSSHDGEVSGTPLVEISLPSTADNSGATGSVMVETPLATDRFLTAGDSLLKPSSDDVPLTVRNSGLETLAITAGVTAAGEMSETPSAEVAITSDLRDVKPAVLEEVYLSEVTDQMSEQSSSSSR
jgi:hypothetical protein